MSTVLVQLRVLRRAFAHAIIAAACLPFLLATAALAEVALPELSLLPFTSSPAQVADAHPLGEKGWLMAGESGLVWHNGTSSVDLLRGRFEGLDAREGLLIGGAPNHLVAAIDVAAGDVVLLLIDADSGAVSEVREVTFPEALPEVLCLYRDPAQGNVSLFTIDALGMLEQRFVYDGTIQALVDISVRRDVGTLGAEGCAVRDRTAELFFVDESSGIWRLPADEESDAIATPVALLAPWGDLPGEVEDIALGSDGSLWALFPEERVIYRRLAYADPAQFIIPAAVEAEAFSVRSVGGEVTLAIIDEATGEMKQASLPTTDEFVENPTKVSPGIIVASAETTPVRRFADAADDPAILVGSSAAGEPLILGTDKREGLAVYGLDGDRLQFLAVGRLNNVDVVSDVVLSGVTRTIAAASNRDYRSISLFDVEEGQLRFIEHYPTGLGDVYGLCMYASDSGVYVFINDTSGAYEQHRIEWEGDQPLLHRVREFSLPSQPEGCVADSETRRIYMGEEAEGIWMAGAEPDGEAPSFIIGTSASLTPDVEGMEIYRNESEALLVVSSQGSDSYAVYDLNDEYRQRASFSIGANLSTGIDGASETDGLAVSSAALPGYPRGILVVQDGRNRMPNAPQNFKIVDWREVDALLARTR